MARNQETKVCDFHILILFFGNGGTVITRITPPGNGKCGSERIIGWRLVRWRNTQVDADAALREQS